MFNPNPRIGQQLLDVPMGEMIRDMAFAIAEAQMRLDENSIEVAEMMGGLQPIIDDDGNMHFEDSRVFFGRERMLLGDAVDLYNSTTDLSLKASIKTAADGHVNEPANDEAPLTLKDGASNASIIYVPQRVSMMELGFAPTFYQFVDTIIEVKISIKYTAESSRNISSTNTRQKENKARSFGFRRKGARRKKDRATDRAMQASFGRSKTVTTSQVNASYSQKYSYSAEGSSLVRTKLVPIPPPAILEERIRLQMELAREATKVDPNDIPNDPNASGSTNTGA